MAEDPDKKEEHKFEFTAEGEAVGYIGMDQAQVRAMQVATETPGDYGPAYSGIRMAFDVVQSEDREDHYVITLSLRPQGEFSGRPGREQFFLEKLGAVAHRQVLALPRPGRGIPVIPVAIGLAVAGVVAVIAVLAVGGLGRGDDSQPGATASLPTATPISATQTPLPTPTKAPAVAPPSEAKPTPAPTATPRPDPTPILPPTATPAVTSSPTPRPTQVSVAPRPPPILAANLAPNPSFEFASPGSGRLPKEWTVKGSQIGRSSFVDAHDGSWALSIRAFEQKPNPSGFGGLSGWPGVVTTDLIPIDPGRPYSLSAWAVAPPEENPGGLWMEIHFYDTADKWLGGISTGCAARMTPGSWRQFQLDLRPITEHRIEVAGTTQVRLELALCLNYEALGYPPGTLTRILYDQVFFGAVSGDNARPATPAPTPTATHSPTPTFKPAAMPTPAPTPLPTPRLDPLPRQRPHKPPSHPYANPSRR